MPWRVGALLVILPLLFTGKAFLAGELYGPADIYYGGDPWKRLAAGHGVAAVRNPILSDVAFQGLPWRAAVKEAVSRGRLPLWNRFLLAGNPLLGAGQAAVFHPSTWFGLFLPLALSATFSSTFTIFLSLLCAALYFRDFALEWPAALVGSVGWGFSTSLLFWNSYAEGISMASLPLLLLGARRLAREGNLRTAGPTTLALLLVFAGGQPETFFFCACAATAAFLWELGPRGLSRAGRAFGLAAAASVLFFLLAAPALFPMADAIRNSSEYRARRGAPGRQSVAAPEAARRLLPAWLPFSHGIYGKSPVQSQRFDGSGMPLAYAGALLFPLVAVGMMRRNRGPHPGPLPPPSLELRRTWMGERAERGRGLFLGFAAAGLLFGASAPGVLDLATRLPGFSIARNYRLVFLTGLGLSGLAAFGAALAGRSRRSLVGACATIALLLAGSFLLARGVFRERAIEMSGTYPTLAASLLAPPLPTLAALPGDRAPYRVTAAGDVLHPNAAALYGLEDVRGYESIVLDRFVETYPFWCRAQGAAFNRIDRLDVPFLNFLNVRFAIASPEETPPKSWIEKARGPEMALFENPLALPRAFVPRRVLFEPDAGSRLGAMKSASDFGRDCWVSTAGAARDNGSANLSLRGEGPDLRLEAQAQTPTLVATSIPDWPGWRVEIDGRPVDPVVVNHAFVGFWLTAGRHDVRLTYRPASVRWGFLAFAIGLAACGGLVLAERRVSGGIRAPAVS